MQDGWQDKVDQLFMKWDMKVTPGCALGIVKDGAFVLKAGYGLSDLDRGEKIDCATCFELESASKQFTAACIVLLADEGKLSLDDNIRQYFRN